MRLVYEYLKACTERTVPISVLVEKAELLHRIPDEDEQDRLRVEWAKEFTEKYPLKEKYKERYKAE